jgi:signal transduction histidine kinase
MNHHGHKPNPTPVYPRLALALALLVVGGVIAGSLYLEHGRIEKRERERLVTQAKVVDENLARQLDGVYLALEGIRKELPLWRGMDDPEAAIRHLRALVGAMPGIRTFLVTDSAGTITASNREQIIGENIRYREYFQAPLKGRNPATLYISPPFRTILGNFVINVALMIPGQKGEFSGVVSAALDPEYFSILLGSVRYSPDMLVALAHGDGRQFLMVPDRKGMSGLDLARPGSFFTRHRETGKPATVMTGIVYATGEERLMALRTIRPGNVPMDKPLVVAVGRIMSTLYDDWRREAVGKGALFAVLVLATSLALYFYQKRQLKFEVISTRYLEELLRAKEEALRANGAKSRFLATVAHEFRTPLSLLTSSTDILDRYGERLSGDERMQQHSHIRNAARQMSALVDTVLSFNQMELPDSLKKPVVIDIGSFCHEIAEEIRIACCSGHEFSVSIAGNCGTALLDEALLRRVVENLLTNAFRYTPAGGAVSLFVSCEQGLLQIMITDSGIGIPIDSQSRVFEAFYRCDNVETRHGLGLGLSIVQEALSQLGGTIYVDSTVGEGTTMRVEIPLIDRLDPEEQPSCTQS